MKKILLSFLMLCCMTSAWAGPVGDGSYTAAIRIRGIRNRAENKIASTSPKKWMLILSIFLKRVKKNI